MDRTTRSYRRWLSLILAIGLVFRLVLSLVLPPGFDESYYLFYGEHPSLSYFDHPVAIGLWVWLGAHLGDGIQALRLPGLLSYTLACGLLAEATRRWFGATAGLIAATIANLSPLLLATGGLLLLPDSPLLLALSLLLLWLSCHPPSEPLNVRQSLLLGTILGFLTLCKYQALVIIASLVALRLGQSIRSGRYRPRETLLVLLSWLVVSSPLWIWNIHNSWLSFAFHMARPGGAPGFRWDGPPLFLLSQLVMLFPSIGIVLLMGLGVRRKGQSKVGPDPEAVATLLWLALPQAVLFLALSARMQVLASWLVPAWWLLVPLAATALAPLWERRNGWLQLGAATTLALVPTLCLLAAAHIRWGIASALIPKAVDTSSQLVDRLHLRQSLQANPRIWQALTQAEVIASNRYELPGFLFMALKGISRAKYTVYSGDPRGFMVWSQSVPATARRGVLFAVVGAYSPIASLKAHGHFQDLRPLGNLTIRRGPQAADELEFYSFDPSRARTQLPKPP